MAQATIAVPRTWRTTLSAYIALIKPHVTVLLLGTTLASMTLAAHGAPPLGTMLATLLGGAMAAGSANAINCWWDRDIDEIMSRTRTRPLPAGRVPDMNALVYGIALGVGSTLIFLRFVNVLSAVFAVAAILFYVVVYTIWLKRTTPQNIVIGGAAGAVPVLIGWSAVTNSVGWPAAAMFLIIFLWTPPHFWALSLVLKGDYARAHVPMLPVVRGERETYRQIIVYSAVLLVASTGLFFLHAVGYFYLVSALAMGAGLLVLAIRLARRQKLADARTLFWCSNYYLALLFAMMVVDRLLS